MAILVTGGAGYIGSHTCVELLDEAMKLLCWTIYPMHLKSHWKE